MTRRSKRILRDLVVLVVVLLGTLIALPTFFPVDPMLQIGNEDGTPLDAASVAAVTAALDEQAAPSASPRLEKGVVQLRFPNIDAQMRAGEEIKAALPGRVVAFNLRPRLPRWMMSLGLRPVTLGLDLRGGVRFVYEVAFDALTGQLLDAELARLRASLREAGIPAEARVAGSRLEVVPRRADDAARIRSILRQLGDDGGAIGGFDVQEKTTSRGTTFAVTPSPELLQARRQASMEQNMSTLRNRVNGLGVAEATVQQQGADRILVEVPGVQDPVQLDRVLGSTATLEWRLDYLEAGRTVAATSDRPPPGAVLRYDAQGRPFWLQRAIIASGEQLTDATFGYSQGRPAVVVRLDPGGARRMREATLHNVGNMLAVVYVEERREPAPEGAVEGRSNARRDGGQSYRLRRAETVIFNGRIDNVLSDRFVLTGLAPVEAKDLALLLRAGALAAPLYKVDSGAVSATLGRENIAKGRLALIAGFLGVVAFMASYYRVFGLIANLAMLANLILIVALLSLLSASLTLPGIAGIVLTVGMAVDANVLIFERIREERRRGKPLLASIDEGYDKAFATITDSNLTTLIAGAVLFVFGTGPIKGFAVTLSLGILTSMFTAVVGTRALIDLVYRRWRTGPRTSNERAS